MLAIAVIREWRFDQLDVNNVFLNGDLEKNVYLYLPLGYEKSVKYYRLRKTLYGLKQPPRVWFDRLNIVMKSMDYR